MKIRSLVAAANIGFMFLLVLGIKAGAAELKVLNAFGMQSHAAVPCRYSEMNAVDC